MSTEMPLAVTWKKNNRKYKSGRIIANINNNLEDKIPINNIYTIHESYIIRFNIIESKKMPAIGTLVTITIGGKRFNGQVFTDEKTWDNKDDDIVYKKIVLSEIIGNKLNQDRIKILHRNAIKG